MRLRPPSLYAAFNPLTHHHSPSETALTHVAIYFAGTVDRITTNQCSVSCLFAHVGACLVAKIRWYVLPLWVCCCSLQPGGQGLRQKFGVLHFRLANVKYLESERELQRQIFVSADEPRSTSMSVVSHLVVGATELILLIEQPGLHYCCTYYTSCES